MIALFLVAATVFENPEPAAAEVSVQALIRLPALDRTEQRALDVLADVLPNTVSGYSRRDMMTITGGSPVRCEVEPDHLRVSMLVPASNAKSAIGLLDALLRRSQISDADVLASGRRLDQEPGYWAAALRPVDASNVVVRGQDVVNLYARLMRPEWIDLAIGGRIEPGNLTERWTQAVERWGRIQPDRANPYAAPPVYRQRNSSSITTVELAPPPFGAADAALSTRILTAVALGTGKGSALFRVARGKLHLSYRQEAVITPTKAGFQPRLIVAFSAREGEPAIAESLRAALLEDVESWTTRDLKRAQGMAEAVLMRNPELSPLSLWRTGPVSDDLEGRTFMRAYWPSKTGQPWNPQAMVDLMQKVALEDLRQTARQELASATVRVLSGSRPER